MANDNEWKLFDGEPSLMSDFGRWDKRQHVEPDQAGSGSLVAREEISLHSAPYAPHIMAMLGQHAPVIKEQHTQAPQDTVDVGKVFLDELKKHHQLEAGFDIEKITNIETLVDDVKIMCQLLIVRTPWKNPQWFSVFSPVDGDGFTKIFSKITAQSGPRVVGEQGTMEKPQPYWSWDMTASASSPHVDTQGPPVIVEVNGKTLYGHLADFFKQERFAQ